MNVNPKFVIRKMMDEVMIVPTGDAIIDFNGMISANDVAGFILLNLTKAKDDEDVIRMVMDEFEVDEETARNDVAGFLNNLRAIGILEKLN